MNLPLSVKILAPSLSVLLVMGLVGAFMISRLLAARERDRQDVELRGRFVSASAVLRETEGDLLLAVKFAANLTGLPEATERRDGRAVRRLAASVAALQGESLGLLAVTDRRGIGLVEIRQDANEVDIGRGGDWRAHALVAEVLQGLTEGGDKRAGLVTVRGRSMFAIAGPVKARKRTVGVVLAARSLDRIVGEASARSGGDVVAYGVDGRVLGSSGTKVPPDVPHVPDGASVRRNEQLDAGGTLARLYAPFVVQGRRLGITSVSGSFEDLAGATGARLNLLLLLISGMAAVAGLGALLVRAMLRQVRPMLAMNRRLAKGEMDARAPVLTGDALGELAQGFNDMVEQLEATYAQLEARVALRTEELQRLYQDLQAVSDSRSQVFAAISHEFRTPLFAIVGHADLMLDPNFTSPDRRWRREFGVTIKQAAEDLLARVNEILDLSRLEAGKMEVKLEPVALHTVVEDVKGTISALAMKGELTTTFDVPSNLPLVNADAGRLRQVILNLVSNAVKYTPSGGGVAISAALDGPTVKVAVSDTGVGIPEGVAGSIFEPFYQVADTRAQKGQLSTGLGLALVKRLVEAHGGTVWYTSRQGEGTTFFFTLTSVAGVPAEPDALVGQAAGAARGARRKSR